MFHPKQSFRASSARWSHGFYQVRSPRQWTSSRFLPSFVAVEQATPDLQSKAIFFCRWSGCTLTLGDTQFLDNMSAWLLYLSWVCSVEGAIYIYMHMHVLYAYTPNGCQFQQEIECQLLVGPIFWAIDDVGSNVYRKKPASPFQLAQTKLLWLVPVIVFFH